MTTDSAADSRLATALLPVLAELRKTKSWMTELDWELKKAVQHREKLIASADNLMQAMGKAQRERHFDMFIEACARPIGRPRRLQGAMRETMEFLVDNEHEHVRAAELTWYVRRCGYKVDSRYGSNTLTDLAKTGHVTKTGHGIYRINRLHPELLAIQMELLEKAKRRAGL